jgi:hypothetical protein
MPSEEPVSDPAIAEIRATAAERPAVRAVRTLVGQTRTGVRIEVGGTDVELPRPLVEALVAAADSLDGGDVVAVLSEEVEVSPAQAAKLLGVSRQYVDRLVASDVLPARRLPNSAYRKIPVRSVLAYRGTRERKRTGIAQIVDEATAAGLPY